MKTLTIAILMVFSAPAFGMIEDFSIMDLGAKSKYVRVVAHLSNGQDEEFHIPKELVFNQNSKKSSKVIFEHIMRELRYR